MKTENKSTIHIPRDVLRWCRLNDFPRPKDAEDVARVERLYEYRVYLFKKACKRLKNAVKKAIKDTIDRHIDYIFGFVIGLGISIIALYFLRHFIF